ncbi:MBL fold metallo-hydrolase [Paenibacillus larvae]
MKLYMLGTGSAFAKLYYNNNALFTAPSGFTLLVDCGNSALRAMHEVGVFIDQINAILITHLHSDHAGGLEEFGFRMRFENARKPHLYIASSLREAVWEHVLKGGMENIGDGLTQLEDYFHVHVLEERKPFQLAPDLQIELIRTRHIPHKPSYSLVINNQMFYSADMVFTPELLIKEMVKERNIRYILHDCQFTPPGAVHATLEELLTLPEEIQSRVYLMHYGDNKQDYVGRTGRMTFIEQHQTYEFDI